MTEKMAMPLLFRSDENGSLINSLTAFYFDLRDSEGAPLYLKEEVASVFYQCFSMNNIPERPKFSKLEGT